MSDLPEGWTWATLGEVGDYQNGRGFGTSEWSTQGRPIIRIQNLTGSGAQFNYFDGELEERHIVPTGSLLVSWAATLGVYIWGGPEGALNQHIFKVRSFVNASYHRWALENAIINMRRQSHGSGMVHITKGLFDGTEVPLPPLAEQGRIVEAIEAAFSVLDAGVAYLEAARKRAQVLRKRVITSAVPIPGPPHWAQRTVKEVGDLDLGRQRHPNWHTGPNMHPYLKVANVFEDHIEPTPLMEMHFDAEAYEKFRLRRGDLLLNEGQSPELLGRPAIFRDEVPGACFTNSLIRFRAGRDVTPEWALLVFRRHLHARRFLRESRITTNIAHLSLTRLRDVEFPIPPPEEQEAIVKRVESLLSIVTATQVDLTTQLNRAAFLRRSILAAAFSGKLAPQDPNDEPASVLLERITAERAASEPTPRRGPRAATGAPA
ncbi:MAG TPA: restriction endonuclease subunit S [Acidimicrobiales bacterium]|nr:restriction endonuclease subunit S [Acidimicrobiales bacterium]